jgi:hypothetical protein
MNADLGLMVTVTGFVLFERFGSFGLLLLMLIFNAGLRVFWVLLGDRCRFFGS